MITCRNGCHPKRPSVLCMDACGCFSSMPSGNGNDLSTDQKPGCFGVTSLGDYTNLNYREHLDNY